MDEAASIIRTEIDSMPSELDEASRKIIQLEIEREALKKESDRNSAERLEVLQKEISETKARLTKCRPSGRKKSRISPKSAGSRRKSTSPGEH
jgi:ATP-dependent Clp protease ATP-binding subunit ClpB